MLALGRVGAARAVRGGGGGARPAGGLAQLRLVGADRAGQASLVGAGEVAATGTIV